MTNKTQKAHHQPKRGHRRRDQMRSKIEAESREKPASPDERRGPNMPIDQSLAGSAQR
jgi:hypothetical protein